MKLYHYLLSITIILILFVGCKKYEEGPSMSLRTPEKRIEGWWKVTEFNIDDINYTGLNNDSCVDMIIFGGDDTDNYLSITFFYIPDSYLVGSWDLIDKKKKIRLNFISNPDFSKGNGPFLYDISSTWDIKRITNEDLWIETNYDNRNYKLILFKPKTK